MPEVTYADTIVRKSDKPTPGKNTPWGFFARGQGQDGYGRKISTNWEAQIQGETKWRKIYAVCFSNVASHYILKNGQTLYIRDSAFPESF